VPILKSSDYKAYSKFIESLAKKLTKFYYSKLNKPFKVSNKLKGRGYDPVTSADKSFEKFIRKEIKKKFPNHQVIGEEFGFKKTKSKYSWIIDPIDGTRSFVIGNPTWSNLISLNFEGKPIIGLANYPVLRKYYFNVSDFKNLEFVDNPLNCQDQERNSISNTLDELNKINLGVDLLMYTSGRSSFRDKIFKREVTLNHPYPFDLGVIWSDPPRRMICLEPWTSPRNSFVDGFRNIMIPSNDSKRLNASIQIKSLK